MLARPMSTWEKTSRWIRRHPAICSTAAIVLCSIGAIVSVLLKANESLKTRDIVLSAKNEANDQRQMAESRLTRAIEAVDKTMARAACKRCAMDPTLQEERRAILENSIEFYNGLIADASDTEVVRWQAVQAHEQVPGHYSYSMIPKAHLRPAIKLFHSVTGQTSGFRTNRP